MTNINLIFGNKYQELDSVDLDRQLESSSTPEQNKKETYISCCCECLEKESFSHSHARG